MINTHINLNNPFMIIFEIRLSQKSMRFIKKSNDPIVIKLIIVEMFEGSYHLGHQLLSMHDRKAITSANMQKIINDSDASANIWFWRKFDQYAKENREKLFWRLRIFLSW